LHIIDRLNTHIFWGAPLLALFIGTGVFFTIKLGFFQVNIFKILKETIFAAKQEQSLGEKADKNALTPFQTLTNSLALTIGTGNIVALGTAIALGGAGAVFWMWFSAFLGMATTYAENFLGMKYRRKRADGSYMGGAFWYIESALGTFPAKAFALCCVFASLGIGNMTQINAMSSSLRHSFGTPLWVSGVIAVIPVGLLVFGGAKVLGKVTEKTIPVISLLYILGCLAVIAIFAADVPAVIARIFAEAFGLRAVGGGVAGVTISRAMSWGFRRGVFSNEAGLGSTVTMNAMSASKDPHNQSLWATLTVFFDTMIICTLTALPILLTGADRQLTISGGELSVDAGMNLASTAFADAFGEYAGMFVTVSVVLFAIATVAGWSVFGARCMEYLFARAKQEQPRRTGSARSEGCSARRAVKAYLVIYVGFAFVGAVMRLDLVWGLADITNGLMAIPNLLAIMWLGLKGEVGRKMTPTPRK
jgi:AGCS family alanine or glycine:cation symporter